MNFGDVKAAVVSAMARDDIPDYVYDLAQAEINTRVRVREMDLTQGLTVAPGVLYVDLPGGFIQMRHAYIGADGLDTTLGGFSSGFSEGFQTVAVGPVAFFTRMEETTGFLLSGEFQPSGMPTQFTIQSGAMRLNPVPDQAYTIVAHYCHAPKVMVGATETNPVLEKFPSLYVYGALRHAAIWAQDVEKAQIYTAAYEGEASRIQKADRVARNSGPLVARNG